MKTKNPKPFCDLNTALPLLFQSVSKKKHLIQRKYNYFAIRYILFSK